MGGVESSGWGPWERTARALGVQAFVCLSLALATAASANASSFTWTGASPGRTESAAHWSNGANWEGGTPPSSSEAIETLTFPHLTDGECTSPPETDACYLTLNDLSGLTVNSIQLDDADEYLLAGEGIALGGGGLTAASPAGTSGFAGSYLEMPIRLSASQRWSVANRSGGELAENGLLVGGNLTGAGDSLALELSGGGALVLANSTEVGPVTVEGQDTSGKNVANGVVLLGEGELNSSDHEPVELSHVLFLGTGAVGQLATNHATLEVGNGVSPAGDLEAADVKLDSASGVIFEITGGGTVAQTEYSQLVSHGSVELAGPVVVAVDKPSKSGCPTLAVGQKYTFISTTGALSGTFSDAPEGGPEIPVIFSSNCSNPSQTMRISYNRTGSTRTVTGTVEARVKETQEEEAKEKQAKETRELEASETEAKEREAREREAATRKLAEEFKAIVLAHEREETERKARESAGHVPASVLPSNGTAEAKGGVLGVREESKSKSPTRTQLLAKALKQCKKQPKRKRAKCEAAAKKRYGKAVGKRGKRG
jgi:hypothetical protein